VPESAHQGKKKTLAREGSLCSRRRVAYEREGDGEKVPAALQWWPKLLVRFEHSERARKI